MLQVHRTGYGVEVDWWSMGVVLFTVLTGYFPFLKTTRKETVNAIVNQPLQFPSKPPLTPDARDCCHKLMAKRPDQRIASLALLKAHPWFQGFNWAACEKRQLRPPFLPTTAGGGGDKKDAKKTDSEYQDEYRAAVSFVQQANPPEKNIFGAFFDAQEVAGSDRDESESESDGDEDEVAAYERLADGLEETKATFNDSNQMLRPFFSSMSVK
ncbi:blue-light receptor-like protein, putative [Bodo saltans]|uniref:Blue-light receptor-like protein, putative n=1 Tax=Bodo saltans TaxID=75058 RepID=A0A0S4KP50_BODSA|nr:blue-light receptor-like protein, putative [Bodo saltans]|eukprot:CUM57941.1 blue-light receptor-like protein, putative [Bodo saltans]